MSIFAPRLPTAALVAASFALAAPALAQDTAPVEPVAPVEGAEPVEAPEAPTAAAPPASTTRKGKDKEDVSVQGTSDRAIWAGGRSVDIEATGPDAFAAGERVTMRGTVLDNFVGAGRNVSVKGPVGGDLFLFGETMELGADVGGDVYAAGESLIIPADVTVGGNVYFGGATLDMDGTVLGSILGGGASIDIDGSVGGDVELEAAAVRIGPEASIGGDLSYESPKKGDVSDQASITGAVDWTEKIPDAADEDEGSGLGMRLFLLLGALLASGVVLGLFPKALQAPAQVLEDEAPVSLGVGFAVLVGVPVLALFLACFILPIPLSLLALAIYVPATVLARFVAAFVVGKLLLERMGQSAKPLGALFAGLTVLHIVYAVPFVGALVMLTATVLGLGALFLAARRATGQTATATA